ncbi:MAG: phosphatase PAP2 family protein [bacterium]|nr:phosphatase PAP2 family protein [bacterium]
MSRFKAYLPLVALFLVWVALTAVAEHWDWDLRFTSLFFDAERGGFYLAEQQPFRALFEVGTWPGLLLGLGSGVAWALGYFRPCWAPYRRRWAVVFLTAIVGGGILVNGFLKDYWGRPRPREVTQFEGRWPYHPIAQPGTPGKGKSFPCGHCTSGFLLVSLGAFIPTHPIPAGIAVGTGLAYGALMSSARIVQGGHFLSDAFWALGTVLMTSGFFYVLLVRNRDLSQQAQLSRRGKWGLALGVTAFLVLSTGLFMTRRPYFKTYHDGFDLNPQTRLLELQLSQEPQSFHIRYSNVPRIMLVVDVQGLGWTEATHRMFYLREQEGPKQIIKARFVPINYFSEISHDVVLQLPLDFKEKDLQIETRYLITPPIP